MVEDNRRRAKDGDDGLRNEQALAWRKEMEGVRALEREGRILVKVRRAGSGVYGNDSWYESVTCSGSSSRFWVGAVGTRVPTVRTAKKEQKRE